MLLIVLLILVIVAGVGLAYTVGTVMSRNRVLSNRTAELERQLGYLEGELRTQARIGDYATSRLADEVLAAYESKYPAES